MADLFTLQTRLAEAEAAYHRLMSGSLREAVDHNGTRIQYSRTDVDKLKRYIAELKSQIDTAGDGRQRRRIIVNQF